MEALDKYRKMRVVPFDVPGHKHGRGNPELTAFLGEKCMSLDVNSMKPLDNLSHPVSVISEAEDLAADAFGAEHAFFIVNGTTAAVQAMILSVCKRGDKIILPRNVHKSVINAIILCGAAPVYVNPPTHQELLISMAVPLGELRRAVAENPDAKAVFVNNPTYYGICSDIKSIVETAHAAGMLVLADEAHGAHFYFGRGLPVTAMSAGADMASVSMHKSGGSLTQSSFLLTGAGINHQHVRQVINLTQTTSASYLLLSSLDISRKNLALHGAYIFEKVKTMAEYARSEINRIGDYYAYSQELVDRETVFDFDITKLSVSTTGTGLSGIEVYDLLRDEYDIQIEFGDTSNILAYISVGDRQRDLERLVGAMSEIRRRFKKSRSGIMYYSLISPKAAVNPQEAFYAEKEALPIAGTTGRICGEIVMCYPPGIPILAPGEKISGEIVDYILYAKEKGCFLTGTEDPEVENLNVIK
ncbi:MAG: aminotransferase class I/II-fold pyridoxal phosphate-dependent enzyme [Oscillospiraceae bacterium]|jgi:arginine/lysine/ornithine decarboxylase|nr:aminotransferase class I/II-fold pyridoxal phosphate-dependent enzyme [Oscillospiraceae bacterium]